MALFNSEVERAHWEFTGYPPRGVQAVHKTGSKSLSFGSDKAVITLYRYQTKTFAQVEHLYGEAIWFVLLGKKSVRDITSKEVGDLIEEIKEVHSDEH